MLLTKKVFIMILTIGSNLTIKGFLYSRSLVVMIMIMIRGVDLNGGDHVTDKEGFYRDLNSWEQPYYQGLSIL